MDDRSGRSPKGVHQSEAATIQTGEETKHRSDRQRSSIINIPRGPQSS
jgi:hypothetical protein